MKRDPRPKLAVHRDTEPSQAQNQALAAIRARTAMEVMRERRELTGNLYDAFGSGDEREESSSLLQLPWHRVTH